VAHLERDLREYLASAPHLRLELILTSLGDLVESEFGSSIHEVASSSSAAGPATSAGSRSTPRDHRVHAAPRDLASVTVGELPIKIWGRYLRDTCRTPSPASATASREWVVPANRTSGGWCRPARRRRRDLSDGEAAGREIRQKRGALRARARPPPDLRPAAALAAPGTPRQGRSAWCRLDLSASSGTRPSSASGPSASAGAARPGAVARSSPGRAVGRSSSARSTSPITPWSQSTRGRPRPAGRPARNQRGASREPRRSTGSSATTLDHTAHRGAARRARARASVGFEPRRAPSSFRPARLAVHRAKGATKEHHPMRVDPCRQQQRHAGQQQPGEQRRVLRPRSPRSDAATPSSRNGSSGGMKLRQPGWVVEDEVSRSGPGGRTAIPAPTAAPASAPSRAQPQRRSTPPASPAGPVADGAGTLPGSPAGASC